MRRTAARPIPTGRLTPGDALAFGITLAVGSVVVLGLLVNVVAAATLAVTIAFYIFVYTMWLKRSTPQNIVIGGAAGALPPVIGWAAVTGGFALEPIVLFLIIFFWTPPHFWALSLYRTEDYARAGIPMLPVVSGARETRRQILLYTLLLAPLGAAPWLLGFAGPLYGVVALVAGGAMIGAGFARAPHDRGTWSEQASVRLLDPLSVPAVRHAAGRSRGGGVGSVRSRRGMTITGAVMTEPAQEQKPAPLPPPPAQEKEPGIRLTDKQQRARRARSIAIALALGALVILFYIVTLVKGPGVLVRPL